MTEDDEVEINSLELFADAQRMVDEPVCKPFLDNVVAVMAHCLADHHEPPRILSEADHDLIRLAASVAMMADTILREKESDG